MPSGEFGLSGARGRSAEIASGARFIVTIRAPEARSVGMVQLPYSPPDSKDFYRVPGLLRAWEIEQILNPDEEFLIEQHGTDCVGTPLYAVYHRARAQDADGTCS
jgi:hypothetical protein